MAVAYSSFNAKNGAELELVINDAWSTLTSLLLTDFGFLAKDEARRLGVELAVILRSDPTGGVVMTSPYQVKIFEGQTIQDVESQAQDFLTTNPTYFISNLFTQDLGTERTTGSYIGLVIYNADAAGGLANYQVYSNWVGAATDEFVKVSGADLVQGYLSGKLAAGANIAFAILNPGANEQLQINGTAAGIGGAIAATQVAYGTGVNIIGGSNNMTYDPTLATGGLTIANTTAATNPTTGALKVGSGVGFGGGRGHFANTSQATTSQYSGAVSVQGGVRIGWGLLGTQTALVVTPASPYTTGLPSEYEAFFQIHYDREGSSGAAVVAYCASKAGVGDLNDQAIGIYGIARHVEFQENWSHLIGGKFEVAHNQAGRPQDGDATSSLGLITLDNFRAGNSAGENGYLRGYHSQLNVNSTVALDPAGTRRAFGADHECNILSGQWTAGFGTRAIVDCTGSTTTTAYGIYAQAIGASTNWAGWFQGNVKVTGKLTVDGLIDPTGLECSTRLANPGSFGPNTIYIDGNNVPILYSGAGGVGATFTGTVTGQTSGATGTVVSDDGLGNLVVNVTHGSFQNGETIADAQVHTATLDEGGVPRWTIPGRLHINYPYAGIGDTTAVPFRVEGNNPSYHWLQYNGSVLSMSGSAPTNSMLTIYEDDTNFRFSIRVDGALLWGPGTGATIDTTLSRSAANLLKTGSGDDFWCDGTTASTSPTTGALRSSGGLGVVGAVNVGDTSNPTGNPAFSGGSIATAGGIGAQGRIWAQDEVASNLRMRAPFFWAGNYPGQGIAGADARLNATNITYGIGGSLSGGFSITDGINTFFTASTNNNIGAFHQSIIAQFVDIQKGIRYSGFLDNQDLSAGNIQLDRNTSHVEITTGDVTNQLRAWANPNKGDSFKVRVRTGGTSAIVADSGGTPLEGSPLADGATAEYLYNGTLWIRFN